MGKKRGNNATDIVKSKKLHFVEKAAKKDKLAKLRRQPKSSKRFHKPIPEENEPLTVHVPSDLESDEDEELIANDSTYISFGSSPKDTVDRLEERPKAPWMRGRSKYKNRNIFLQLHEEILDFVSFLSPTQEEIAMRKEAIECMQNVVNELWEGASIEAFGSHVTEMYLPTSDIDLVVYGAPQGKQGLWDLATRLQDLDIVSYLEVIDSARIPIVKLVHAATNLQIDFSFHGTSGLSTADLVMMYIRKYPSFRPLVIVLKYFLVQRGLNETFKGGVGSFLLQLLVVSFLQQYARNHTRSNEHLNLGVLLVEFFELYGNSLNQSTVGICVRNGGSYFMKDERDWRDANRPFMLCVENPHDPSHDVAANSYDIRKVFRTFAHASRSLQAEIAIRGRKRSLSGSILERIIALDSFLMERTGPTTFGFNVVRNDPEEMAMLQKRYESRPE
ncbi:Poly(A) RNA polymerase [Thraustotheca clavata]|uniref:polynucleotide adenylyltransferase n=1 Tax=Thraustotheca clavata TaxID=74557 RepID=A0A1V9ZX42_9STRA|nr:Poly(A) RNA polymerase [Thraustotheca clavata]